VFAALIISAALIVAGACWMAARAIAAEIRAARDDAARGRLLAILQTLTPGIAAAQADPRALLVWQPLARVVRQGFPTEAAALDRAAGATFPFTPDQIQAAHARWTAEWLAWERLHDAEFKQKAAELEQEVTASGGSAAARARLDAVEREKLDLYQRHYQEYVQVAKALQALTS